MKSTLYMALLAGLSNALPQASQSCDTTTIEVIVPTSTATYLSTVVTTIEATTADDLGTFTDVVRVSSTQTVATVTASAGDCTDASTVYAAASSGPAGYGPGEAKFAVQQKAAACTVTVSSTTTYGQTYTFAPASETSTYTDYTAFTQATVTSTSYGGTAYAIATASATTDQSCLATVTQDPKCAPSALVSGAGGSDGSPEFGILYTNDVTSGGAVYSTNTTDGSICCQQCVEAESCSASAWDSRTGECKLAFTVQYGSGDLYCGTGFLAFYDYGPASPMDPGTGYFVAGVCGNVQYAGAKPDDGT